MYFSGIDKPYIGFYNSDVGCIENIIDAPKGLLRAVRYLEARLQFPLLQKHGVLGSQYLITVPKHLDGQ